MDKRNISFYKGISLITNIDVTTDESKIIFGWEITNDVTQQASNINFSIRFYTIEDNVFSYSFNTLPASSVIFDTLDIENSSHEDVTPSELQNYLYKMNSLKNQIENYINTGNSGEVGTGGTSGNTSNTISQEVILSHDEFLQFINGGTN